MDDENDSDDDSETSDDRRQYLDPDVNDFGELNVLRDANAVPPPGELVGDIDRDIDFLLYEVRQHERHVAKMDYHPLVHAVEATAYYPKL